MLTRYVVSACLSALAVASLAACSDDPGATSASLDGSDAAGPGADGGPGTSGEDATTGGDGGAPAKVPCPAGMPARWTCDATTTHRVRCIDGFVQSFACGDGCVAASGVAEATCSCGANTTFSHWNCGADGDLHACAGGAAWHDQSCGGRGCDAAPAGVSDTCKLPTGSSLQAVVTSLGAKCGTASPGTACGIAVRDLTTGEHAHHRGTAPYVSASSAKTIWVAAALYDTSIADVEPHATPIFADSDNSESGLVIDLLSSPDRVNTFMWQDIGAPDSAFCSWSYDKTRRATSCPTPNAPSNVFTANDMAAFMTVLADGSLLGSEKSKTELQWMTLSPRTGYGGWMGTRLPPAARPKMAHKAGWLPPDVVRGRATANDIGVIEVPGGHSYAVALLTEGATDIDVYEGKQLPLLERASCVVYHAVAKDVADPFAICDL